MPGPAQIRTATQADDEALLRLEAAAWSPLGDFPSTRDQARASFFDETHLPDDLLVAQFDGRVVGYLRLRPVTPLPENSHVLGIFGLAVHPYARRRGVASLLLDAAEALARELGARKLHLRVFSSNAPARALYARRGFLVEGVLREEFLIESGYVDDVIMAKPLT